MALTELFPGLTALPRSSTVDRVTEWLRDQLLSGDLAPGTNLQEIPLAAALGVSRNTLREAVRTLAAEGLLCRTPHKGIVVPSLTPDDVNELFEIRELLEVAALRRACARPEKILPLLEDKVEGLRRAVAARNERGVVEMDLAFHETLLNVFDSPRLQHFHTVLISELRLALAFLDRKTSADSVEQIATQHQQILNAVKSGEVEKSTKRLAKHLHDSKTRLIQLLQAREQSKLRAP
jgi:DNA-binding GntR family transcriptional regulator